MRTKQCKHPGSQPSPVAPPSSLWVLFWHSSQYTVFFLRASSVGNRSKEKGWGYPSQLYDRLANYKNSEGKRLLTAASVAYRTQKKKCSSSTTEESLQTSTTEADTKRKDKKKYRVWGLELSLRFIKDDDSKKSNMKTMMDIQ